MSNILHITSPMPPSVNHYMGYRMISSGGKPLAVQYTTNEAKKYQKNFGEIVIDAVERQGWNVPVNTKQHFYVDAVFYFPRARMDCNNYWKVMLDAITHTQRIWMDDDVVCERAQAIFYDTKNPRIELTIHPVDYIGVFENSSQLDEFESNCIGCSRYTRNCSILRNAKSGRIQDEINGTECSKFKPKKENKEN